MCSLEKQKPEGIESPSHNQGLGGFVECRVFSAKIITVPGKSGQSVTLLVTEHGTGHSQSDAFSCNLPLMQEHGAYWVSVDSLRGQL